MDPSALTQWATIAEIVGGLTVSTLLAIGLILFYRGKLMSRIIVDEIKGHAEDQTKLLAAEMSKGIVDGMGDSIEKSIVAAVKQLNGGDK